MATSAPTHAPIHVPHLPVRTRRVLDGSGDEQTSATVYCPVREVSTPIATCEACQRFRALHFDAKTRTTSVVCACGAAAPADEISLRDALGGPPDPGTPLADLMSRQVVCVTADTGLDELRSLLVESEIGGVPVVDERGRPIGIVSRADVLRADHDRGDTQEMREITARPRSGEPPPLEPGSHLYEPVRVTAGDVMSPVVLALHESSNIGQAASLMAYEGVHQLPVIADGGEVVGILSALDVLRWFGRRSGYLIPPARKRV